MSGPKGSESFSDRASMSWAAGLCPVGASAADLDISRSHVDLSTLDPLEIRLAGCHR